MTINADQLRSAPEQRQDFSTLAPGVFRAQLQLTRAVHEAFEAAGPLDAWREAPHYSEQERAALALTEAITRVGDGQVPDQVWDAAAALLSQEQMAAVIAANVEINGWNRIAISTRMPPGEYQPG